MPGKGRIPSFPLEWNETEWEGPRMKKRFLRLLFIFITATTLLCTGILTAEDQKKGKVLERVQQQEQEIPEEIIISNEGYRQERKVPVKFPHVSHAADRGLGCEECHHNYEDGKNIWKEGDFVNKCIECHDPRENQDNVKKLMLAFHQQCSGCHQNRRKEGSSQIAPYKKCYECHQKKSEG